MHIRKVTRISHFLLVGVLLAGLLLSCENPFSVMEESSGIPDNLPPEPATKQTRSDTTIKITPLPVDDYLTNPGMGWQDGPEPFGIMNFPETVAYSNRRLIAWSKLNPAEGFYDWSPLEAQLDRALQDGEQFSFRVYTYVGEEYDGNMIPEWVLEKGARLLPSGEPDYSNCVYQKFWGEFVTELMRVYDGNMDIAFIDISGYGDFNEWSWQDEQTEWDEQWMVDYGNGAASAAAFQTLDGQARRRLADIFIGGSFSEHLCRMPDGETAYVDYAYPGFQKTQLLMPYAGIVQSSQYVYSRRQDIGFRHDCLGRNGRDLFEKIGAQIDEIWQGAPVVYELCKPDEMDIADAQWLLQTSHASIVHNNNWSYSRRQLEDMMLNVGYRYFLKSADLRIADRMVDLHMEWQNIGFAPSYPKMGQQLNLYFFLVDHTGEPVFRDRIPVDISNWLPALSTDTQLPSYSVAYSTQVPSFLMGGRYQAGVAIVETRTGKSINLSFEGRDQNGINILSSIVVE